VAADLIEIALSPVRAARRGWPVDPMAVHVRRPT
jgi:hypothetical protein